MKVAVQVTPVSVIVGAGLIVAAYAVWRGAKSAAQVVDWVTGIPARVAEYAQEGGRTFLDQQIPNEINRVNTPGNSEPVYTDPLKNDDGMDFRYF